MVSDRLTTPLVATVVHRTAGATGTEADDGATVTVVSVSRAFGTAIGRLHRSSPPSTHGTAGCTVVTHVNADIGVAWKPMSLTVS